MSGAGFAQFARDLQRVAASLDVKANRAAERVGRGALVTAKAAAPTDKGNLRAGLRMQRKGSTVVLISDQYYSAFQEYGTSQMAPNPFMAPAVDKWGPELVREVERIADDVEGAL